MIDQESLKRIEDLHRLCGEGIITEAEFEQAKQKLLFGSKPKRSGTGPAAELSQSDVLAYLKMPLQRYADFRGRSGRKEFWLFQLVPVAIGVVLLIAAVTGNDLYGDLSGTAVAFITLAILALLVIAVPQIALQVRRMHDQDIPGWYVLLNLIPYVGPIVVLVFMALPGSAGENRYGPNPDA
ncbi:DUF805 domain-containing protein [Sphingoaurantiacus capsulatus]|uniref:DUF805 domain-containing protein n=1 Tax=Sphingoaurantiacus capsulatus TaxID=1771310 RepID=A0ABV7XDZ2_9SPHN